MQFKLIPLMLFVFVFVLNGCFFPRYIDIPAPTDEKYLWEDGRAGYTRYFLKIPLNKSVDVLYTRKEIIDLYAKECDRPLFDIFDWSNEGELIKLNEEERKKNEQNLVMSINEKEDQGFILSVDYSSRYKKEFLENLKMYLIVDGKVINGKLDHFYYETNNGCMSKGKSIKTTDAGKYRFEFPIKNSEINKATLVLKYYGITQKIELHKQSMLFWK